MPYLTKRRRPLKSNWLVKVRLFDGLDIVYSINTEELRAFMAKNRTDKLAGNLGIINKYVFPCVLEKFKDENIKSIKIKGNYDN